MQKMLKRLAGLVVVAALVGAPVIGALSTVEPVWAQEVIDAGGGGSADSKPVSEETGGTDESGKEADNKPPETSILPNDMDIMDILKLVLDVLVYGLGVAAVLGVIIAAIMYLTARDNEAQVTKAKTRLYEVVIGLVAWAVMWAVLNWLVPGGLNFG